jgi:hypothetical protein
MPRQSRGQRSCGGRAAVALQRPMQVPGKCRRDLHPRQPRGQQQAMPDRSEWRTKARSPLSEGCESWSNGAAGLRGDRREQRHDSCQQGRSRAWPEQTGRLRARSEGSREGASPPTHAWQPAHAAVCWHYASPRCLERRRIRGWLPECDTQAEPGAQHASEYEQGLPAKTRRIAHTWRSCITDAAG